MQGEGTHFADCVHPFSHLLLGTSHKVVCPVLCFHVKHVLVLLVREVGVHGLAVLKVDHTLQIPIHRLVVLENLARSKAEESFPPCLDQHRCIVELYRSYRRSGFDCKILMIVNCEFF